MGATPLSVRVLHLYPRLLSVAGDHGNLLAFLRRCAWRGIEATVTDVEVGDPPAGFESFDLVLFHGGQDPEMAVAADDLAGRAGDLETAVEGGTVVLAVCAGYQLLCRHYVGPDGVSLVGTGLLDAVTEADPGRFMGHAVVGCDLDGTGERWLVGFENHGGRTRLGPGVRPLGRVVAGAGNNGLDGGEGARYREVYATYLHGPVLPKNPWFADHLLLGALRHHHGDVDTLPPLDDAIEQRAHEAAERRAAGGRRHSPMAGRPSPTVARTRGRAPNR